MTNKPEKSVEEIVEEFKHLKVPENREDIKGWKKMDNWLTQTLQAERQKREEMVEAERIKTLQECLQECSHEEADHIDDCQSNIRRLIELTQPNNPK